MPRTQFEVIISYFADIPHAVRVTGISDANWRNWKNSGLLNPKSHLSIIMKAKAADIHIPPHAFSEHLVDALIESARNETSGAVPAAAG